MGRKMIYLDDAIDAIDKRIQFLKDDPVFRRKHGDIDLYGIKPIIQTLPSAQFDVTDINVGDINKFIDSLVEIFADIRETNVDESVCGLCEFDGAYIGESGDWCNECPGFDRADCFKLRDGIRERWITEITACMPSAQPERKKGKWILTQDEQYEYCTCSECGYENGENWMIGADIPFCPNCGADMRGKQDE